MNGAQLLLDVKTAAGRSTSRPLGLGPSTFRLDGAEKSLAIDRAHRLLLAGAADEGRVLLYVLRFDPKADDLLVSAYSAGNLIVSDAGRAPDAISVSTKDGTIKAAGTLRGADGARPALFTFRWSKDTQAYEPAGSTPAPPP